MAMTETSRKMIRSRAGVEVSTPVFLQEATEADLLLHVVDAAGAQMQEQRSEVERVLAEIARVLRPGGVFLYADFRFQSGLADWDNAFATSPLVLRRQRDHPIHPRRRRSSARKPPFCTSNTCVASTARASAG